MVGRHDYTVEVRWTGNLGSGTSGYRDFDRDMTVTAAGPPELLASSDPNFRGDPARWNPELLLLASLSECHLLWYLHLCSVAGVVVESYVDNAEGVMEVARDGGGRFTEVTLRPRIVVREESMIEKAHSLHGPANEKCFIANSVNFTVHHEAEISAAE